MSGLFNSGRPNKYWPDKKEGSKPPKAAGEYRIRDSKGKMQYVGITNDLNRRMHEHENTGRLKNNAGASFEWQQAKKGASYDDLRVHEQQKIHQHNPSLNRSKGGEGRGAKI